MRNPTVVRGILAGGPVLTFENKVGTPLSTVTGTATDGEGSWQLQIQNDFYGVQKIAIAIEHLRGGEIVRMHVKPSTAYTNIIAGLTITFGATINAGDIANISYTSLFVVNTA